MMHHCRFIPIPATVSAAAFLVVLCLLPAHGAASAEAALAPATPMTRCGWFDNPSPGNADLIDAGGSWSVAQQGGHQAEGPWPAFPSKRWVRTGAGSYGYGCACLTGHFDGADHKVLSVTTSRTRPLSACRGDKAFKSLEPSSPWK